MTYQVGVAFVAVDNRVPEGVEVADTVFVGDPIAVTAAVTLGELIINLRGGVQGLVDVTDVVDDETEGKRALVLLIGKAVLNLRDIGTVGNVFAFEEGSQVGKGINHVDVTHLKVRIGGGVTAVVVVGLVDKVPVALEFVALALDVVGKGCALSERMVTFVLGEARLRGLEVG